MSDEIDYTNNPLHGVGLKTMLTDIVNHYGFDILFAYLNINCFKNNPSIASSVKFLKKTDWAREKVENFYMYQFKSLPRATAEQFALSPRDRIVPEDQKPGEPAVLSLEDAERLREKQAQKRGGDNQRSGHKRGSHTPYAGKRDSHRSKRDFLTGASEGEVDPWAKRRKR